MTPTSTGHPGWQLGSVGLHQWQLQSPSESAHSLSSLRVSSDGLANLPVNPPHFAASRRLVKTQAARRGALGLTRALCGDGG